MKESDILRRGGGVKTNSDLLPHIFRVRVKTLNPRNLHTALTADIPLVHPSVSVGEEAELAAAAAAADWRRRL